MNNLICSFQVRIALYNSLSNGYKALKNIFNKVYCLVCIFICLVYHYYHYILFQVTAGQHVHLSGDIKGNVSIAAQQGMHFTHQSPQSNSQPQSGSNSNHHSPMSTPQHQGSPMSNGVPSQGPMGHQTGPQMSGGNLQMSGGPMGPGMQVPGGMGGGNMAGK